MTIMNRLPWGRWRRTAAADVPMNIVDEEHAPAPAPAPFRELSESERLNERLVALDAAIAKRRSEVAGIHGI